jgi:glycosyltransferase involved in cell wall biosynthesis
MNVLFIHNNFPAQYNHLARALAQKSGVRVVAIGTRSAKPIPGVDLRRYVVPGADASETHPFARRFDLECRRAEQVLYALSALTSSGFTPDLVLAHPGWGESLPLRAVFRGAKIVSYCEFYYRRDGQDVGFDPEFGDAGADSHVALHLKNAATLLALIESDAGVSPTQWQKSTYPKEFQDRIEVFHEGVDTEFFKPNPDAVFRLPNGRRFSCKDEVVTFVARNLEPLRGYHLFMRALPRILETRPKAEILIVGENGVSYGRLPPEGQTWKSIFYKEVVGRIDRRRVHFTGRLPYSEYLTALQISSAHIYFTYPFVLSWSVLEAMSAGCLVIGSDTAPVREVVIHEENGLLSPFFDADQLADHIVRALAEPNRFRELRAQARRTVLERYDVATTCLPKMLTFLNVESRSSDRGSLTPRKRSARGKPWADPDALPTKDAERRVSY